MINPFKRCWSGRPPKAHREAIPDGHDYRHNKPLVDQLLVEDQGALLVVPAIIRPSDAAAPGVHLSQRNERLRHCSKKVTQVRRSLVFLFDCLRSLALTTTIARNQLVSVCLGLQPA